MTGGTYFRVGSQFWHDPIVRGWDHSTKLIALYVLTCPHRITEGLFRLPAAYVVADTEFSFKQVEISLKRLNTDGFVERDADMILIVNALKWQAPKSPANVTHAVRRALSFQTPLLVRLLELARQLCPPFAAALVAAKPELSNSLSTEARRELDAA